METKAVIRKTIQAHKALAELKRAVRQIPNKHILTETLPLREARESSAIENIISTYDEVYQSSLAIQQFATAQAKEIHLYAGALKIGFDLVKKHGLLTINYILNIQQVLEENNAGFRKLPGTKLLNDKTGEVVYTPPQEYNTIVSLMENLEEFINNDEMMDVDPLVKMAIIHHQFETIHPFYDGNGRTGRIINILYLIQKELLDLPVLYLSSFITDNKTTYYSLLQNVRENDKLWEKWILFMLEGIEQTAKQTVSLIDSMMELMQVYKEEIRSELPKIYTQDLLNNLFKYPYTKIEYLQMDLHVSRNTAIRYLEALVKAKLLSKQKKGRDNFYVNQPLFDLLSNKKVLVKSMQQKEEEIKEPLCNAIEQRRLVRFYYESDSSRKKEWRTVKPFIIGIKENGSFFLAGLPITELTKKIEKREIGHYLLRKINITELEILSETFKDPSVPKNRVVETVTIKVICRFIYDDEDAKEVRKNWIKIKGLDL